MVNSLQHQPPTLLATEPAVTVNHITPTPANDPVVRKQVVQDLMAQMQGTYNFMQVEATLAHGYKETWYGQVYMYLDSDMVFVNLPGTPPQLNEAIKTWCEV